MVAVICNALLREIPLSILLQISRKYPNKGMAIGMRATNPPTVSIKPQGANFTIPAAIDFYVIDGQDRPLTFTLGVVSHSPSISKTPQCTDPLALLSHFKPPQYYQVYTARAETTCSTLKMSTTCLWSTVSTLTVWI